MKENSPESYSVRTKNDSILIIESENQTEIYMNGNLIGIADSDKEKSFFPEEHIVNTPKNQYILTEKENNITIYKNGVQIKKIKTSKPKPEVCSGDCDNDDLCESSCIKKAHSLSSSIGEKK
jgi:hypothetical protein